MVPISSSDCSKCTPFYMIFAKNFSLHLLVKNTTLSTRFFDLTCVPTSRPNDPPVTSHTFDMSPVCTPMYSVLSSTCINPREILSSAANT
jgi:hypothetical protein